MKTHVKTPFCIFAAAILLLSVVFPFAVPARAASVVAAPAVTVHGTEADDTDTLFRFTLSAPDALVYETYRRQTYEAVAGSYTDEEIARSEQSWLLYPVLLLCEAAPAGGNACPVKTFPADAAEVSLSLYAHILPALAAGGGYTTEAFSFVLSFSVVADINGTYTRLSDAAAAGGGHAPATVHLDYVLPEGTDNGGNPAFLPAPLTEPLALSYPTLQGHTFGGWQTENGMYVDTVPAGTREMRLYARFTPKTYKINYVLTTRPGYAFVRVPNDRNPQYYACGEETPLLPVNAPRGYVFGGWFRRSDFSGEEVTAIGAEETGAVILYARWLTEEEAREETRKKEQEEALRKAGWGDLNDDGDVTAADARLALRAAVGLENLPSALISRADFSGAGKLTAANARLLLRIAVGLDALSDVLREYGLL